jgi:hypothetical protein
MKRSQTLGAALVGLVALHEHDRTLRQERRLAGKPTLGDRVPFGLLAVIFEVLTIPPGRSQRQMGHPTWLST